MSFTTTENNADYINSVKIQRRDWFLAALFLPVSIRDAVLAIYALDVELEHVHHVVKEEMIGHIRYAWWQEKIEALRSAAPTEGHPLLQALAVSNIAVEMLLPIVTAYRESFPEYPAGSDEIVMNVARSYLANNAHTKKWEKATAMITTHRKKYGKKLGNWLLVKLLFA